MSAPKHMTDYPRDRDFWVITAEETVERMHYWPGGSAWAGSPLYSCVDDEKAAYAEGDLFDWAEAPEPLRAILTATGEGA